jgi:hypothetical protein
VLSESLIGTNIISLTWYNKLDRIIMGHILSMNKLKKFVIGYGDDLRFISRHL